VVGVAAKAAVANPIHPNRLTKSSAGVWPCKFSSLEVDIPPICIEQVTRE